MSTKIPGEPIDQYHAHDAVGSTKLDVFHESPLAYFEQFVAKSTPPKESWSFDFGAAFHALMESFEVFQRNTVLMKFDSFRTDASKEWREEMKKSKKLILTSDEHKRIGVMKAKTDAHPVAAQLLANTEAEITWRKSFGKYKVQCRTDRWSGGTREINIGGKVRQLGNYFVDFKSTDSIAQFRKNWLNFGYARQKVWYQLVLSACLDLQADAPPPEGFWIVTESEPPHEVRVFELGATSFPVARAEVMTDLRSLKRCYDTNDWNAPAEIESLELPGWYVAGAEKRLLEQQKRLEITA